MWKVSTGLLRRTVFAGMAVGIAVSTMPFGGCAYTPRQESPVPPRLEVQAPAYLSIAIQGVTKQPMTERELTPPQKAGFHWECEVVFQNAGTVGIRLEMLRMTVRSLSGTTSSRVQSLPSRVEPGGSTPISVQAFLSTSDLGNPADLVGTHELVFLGTDDQGRPIRIDVQVPLE